MSRHAFLGPTLLAALLTLQAPGAVSADRLSLLTGPESSIQPQIGREIVAFVANPAGIELRAIPTDGPAESLRRLRDELGRGLALLPSDTAHAYLDAARRGNPAAGEFVAPLRVIAPLYPEEFYFIVRSDSKFGSVHDIRDARINIGPVSSATALSTSTLYRLLFDAPIPDQNATFLSHEDALVKLITDGSIDVVVIVAEQPARLLANMKPEARQFIKLLKFDPTHPGSAAALRVYDQSTIRAGSYPNLLTADMPALANKLYLVAYIRRRADDALLARFGRSWCENLPRLQREGNPKWRDVEVALPELKPGWAYAKPAERELARCKGTAPAPAPASCSQQDRILGLCD